MCGIVGYTGPKQAAPILLEGLSKLEYRGYDSAGIAVRDKDKEPVILKAKGRLKMLAEKTNNGEAVPGNCGIGHTRWATHGEPSELNAHPHKSDDLCVVGVHNGIIESYVEIKEKLIRKGYSFQTQTDTETLIKYVDYYYKKYKMGPIDAIAKTMVRIRGSYAVALMFKDYPGEIYVARKESPMIIGVGEDESYIASDVPAILNYTRQVYYIDNMEMARLSGGEVTFYNLNGDVVEKELKEITWDAEAAEKGGYEHFMIKEIHEQPRAIKDTIGSLVNTDTKRINLESIGITEDEVKNINRIHVVACGSAYHAGVVGQYVMEDFARIPVRVELASEFRYRKPILCKGDLVIVVSQSGETADTLAALREAKSQGIKTLAIVNVVGSSIAREADNVFYTLAGPEIAVATTKAYSTQIVAFYLLAAEFGRIRTEITELQYQAYVNEILTIPAKVESILDDKEQMQRLAAILSAQDDIFFLGRGIDYAVCLEGSLKLKEISYIHSEAYAAGELKHGTISLIDKGTPVIAVLTQNSLYEKSVSNIVEVKSRGAYVCGVTYYGSYSLEGTVDQMTYIPKIDDHFAASLSVIPLQLISYYVSLARGLDVDKPRNLAKSVTVE